jgi:hypothetical protein
MGKNDYNKCKRKYMKISENNKVAKNYFTKFIQYILLINLYCKRIRTINLFLLLIKIYNKNKEKKIHQKFIGCFKKFL